MYTYDLIQPHKQENKEPVFCVVCQKLKRRKKQINFSSVTPKKEKSFEFENTEDSHTHTHTHINTTDDRELGEIGKRKSTP